jgi:hypothetical protein
MSDSTDRGMMPLDIAGEGVTRLVKANARTILTTKMLGAQRQKNSRNALSEMTFSHWELTSMLAVAIDRLAVHEALTPTLNLEQGINAFKTELGKLDPTGPLTASDIRRLTRAVLDR